MPKAEHPKARKAPAQNRAKPTPGAEKASKAGAGTGFKTRAKTGPKTRPKTRPKTVKAPVPDGLKFARLAVEAALDRKGQDPVILDLRGLSSVADFYVIVSGTSDRQVLALADGVDEAFRARGVRPFAEDGLSQGRWVVLDYVDVVVHVFQQPVRRHFDLERLWIDAPRLPVPRGETVQA